MYRNSSCAWLPLVFCDFNAELPLSEQSQLQTGRQNDYGVDFSLKRESGSTSPKSADKN